MGFNFNFPDDILVEILCRLPDKPLIRFKVVSKSWHSIINNFCVPILSKSAPICGILYHDTLQNGTNLQTQYIPFTSPEEADPNGFVQSYKALLPSDPASYKLLDCCNGLLLFVRENIPQYYVCNPATKQCVEIPRFFEHPTASYSSLVFNPSKSPHYKVVRVDHTKPDACLSNPPRLDIFSSDTGKWITGEVPIEAPVYGVRWLDRAAYLDGVLYMLSLSNHLLCFNLKAMNACAIELPTDYRTIKNNRSHLRRINYIRNHMGTIGASRDHLYYAIHDGPNMQIWLLENHSHSLKDGSPWILKHALYTNYSMEDYLGKFISISHLYHIPFMPFAFHPTPDVWFLGIPELLGSYDPENNKLEIIFETKLGGRLISPRYPILPYSRCLVSLKDSIQVVMDHPIESTKT